MTVIRQVVGETIRGVRLRQRRTLRQVSASARVSLGYLSEIERGQKEASSELLAAICDALDVRLSDVFSEVSDTMRRYELMADRGRLAASPGPQLNPASTGNSTANSTGNRPYRSVGSVGAPLKSVNAA